MLVLCKSLDCSLLNGQKAGDIFGKLVSFQWFHCSLLRSFRSKRIRSNYSFLCRKFYPMAIESLSCTLQIRYKNEFSLINEPQL